MCTRGDEKIYVQVAYLIANDATREREFDNLGLLYDNYPKFVVSLVEHAGGNIEGSRHVYIRELLKQLI